MPAYEYVCKECVHRFEVRQKMSDAEIEVCPQCGGAVRRLISGGAGAITKGASLPMAPCGMGGGCGMGPMGGGGGCCSGGGCGHAH